MIITAWDYPHVVVWDESTLVCYLCQNDDLFDAAQTGFTPDDAAAFLLAHQFQRVELNSLARRLMVLNMLHTQVYRLINDGSR